MIYHTAADKIYFDAFFKRWHTSIKHFQPTASFSLRFVGEEDRSVEDYCIENNILLSNENISLSEIEERFKVTTENARGYYALSRWLSIPDGDDVCVSDVDLVQLNPLDINFGKLLREFPFASIARQKTKHPNMMMCFYISKEMTATVRKKAIDLLDKNILAWDTDISIMTWIHKNYPIYLDFGMFQLDKINNIKPHVKFGYFSTKTHEGDTREKWQIKKYKYESKLGNLYEK